MATPLDNSNAPQGGQFDGGRELFSVEVRDSMLGSLLGRMGDALNSLARNAGVPVIGKATPPPRVDSISVKGTLNATTNILTAPSEHLHWTLAHNQSVEKNIHYFTEISANDNFTQPHVIDHGTSRSGFISIPSLLDDGVTPQSFYLRSFAQYPGSEPSHPTVLGNFNNATLIQMTGTSVGTLLPSTGSGTAASSGEAAPSQSPVLSGCYPRPQQQQALWQGRLWQC